MPALTGQEVVSSLQSRGAQLGQRVASVTAADRSQILRAIKGGGGWPTHLNKIRREWEAIDRDVRQYAESFANVARVGTSVSADDYAGHLRRVVLAQLDLEELADPAAAAFARETGLISRTTVDRLRQTGFVVLDDALERGGLSASRLRADLALLHKHGVIGPSPSSCNPGAHGVLLRCGSEAERESFVQQGTTELLRAVQLLRALPSELRAHGYPVPLQLPPTFLASAYPPGAYYQRHLDNYGSDNSRALTLILYANPGWRAEDGGAFRAEVGGGAVEVPPEAGTLLLFDSRAVWHQVLPSAALRFAVTLWVYGPPAAAPESGADVACAALHAAAAAAGLSLIRTSRGTEWVWRHAPVRDVDPRQKRTLR